MYCDWVKIINEQKNNLKKLDVIWLNDLKKINKDPSIFIANEFFDALAIKQFIKKKKLWYEKFINIENKNNMYFFLRKTNMKKFN